MTTVYNAVPKQQAFRIVVTGLKPLTTHIFYFDGLNRVADCKADYTDTQWGTYNQPASAVGAPLVTDNQGKLKFDFFFTPLVADNIDALKNLNNSFIGDKKFELRATGSSASKLVSITRKTVTVQAPTTKKTTSSTKSTSKIGVYSPRNK